MSLCRKVLAQIVTLLQIQDLVSREVLLDLSNLRHRASSAPGGLLPSAPPQLGLDFVLPYAIVFPPALSPCTPDVLVCGPLPKHMGSKVAAMSCSHGEQGRVAWRALCCINRWVCCPITQPDIKLVIWFEENLLVPPRHGACTLGQKKCCQIYLLDAVPVDTGGWKRGCAVTGINQLRLDQAGFSELHCLLFTTFGQGRQASCAWASGSRQRSTLSSPKTRVLEQSYGIHDFRCPEILAVMCTDGIAAGILGGIWDVIAVPQGVSMKLQRQL